MFYPELVLVAAFVVVVWQMTRELPGSRRFTVGVLVALGVSVFLALIGAYVHALVAALVVVLAFGASVRRPSVRPA